jgi:hypothetical protein
MKYYFLIAVLAVIILLPLSIMWYDHTGTVQEMVQEDITEYQEVTPDWIDLQDSDPEQVARHAMQAVTSIMSVLGGKWNQDETYEYRQSLFDVIAAGLNNPTNLAETLQVVAEKHNAWIAANINFIGNRLYAMQYTF